MTAIRQPSFTGRVRRRASAALALLLSACATPTADAPLTAPSEPSAARPVSGPTVASVNPAYGIRGTTIDVRVTGTGFGLDAKATWLLKGVAIPAKVRTNSTTYVSSTEVVANITISTDADLAFWDVQIAAGGKNGVGTESFEVSTGRPTATFLLSNDATYLLRGDGGYVDLATGASRYANGECGVTTAIHSLPGGSGDATMNIGQAGKCPRRVRITYEAINPDGTTSSEGTLTSSSFLNVRKLHQLAADGSPASVIPVFGSARRTFAFDDGGTKCGTGGTGAILFAPMSNDNTIVTGADSVNVQRVSADTWIVTTQPDEVDGLGQTIHHDKAFCKGNGKLYHMPLRFTIISSTPLAP
jgi:hypothetical protein